MMIVPPPPIRVNYAKDAITKYFNIAEFSVLPKCDVKMRALYHYIAEGIICKNTWYRDWNHPVL